MHRHCYAVLFLLALSAPVAAQVRVTEPWVRATVAHQTASGAFMRITSPRDARLVAVRSPEAGVAEIHGMSMDNGVMRMRPAPGIDLPAGRTVELKPGGYHVMLMGLKRQLRVGDSVSLLLTVEGKDGKRESLSIQAGVRPLNSVEPTHPGH
ncbi:MAG TPA: copper chaperone PCu(A)C [Burkholderiales bacterium]